MKTEKPDFGTNELHKQKVVIIPRFSGRGAKVMDEQEIDCLLLKGWITQSQHSALEGFLRRLHKASYVGLKSPAYDTRAHSDPATIGNQKAIALLGVLKLLDIMDEKMGSANRRAIVNLVLLDHEWPGDKETLQTSVKHLEDAVAGR